MTSKEFARIREFYGNHYNIRMRGHIWLYSKAIVQMPTPSFTMKDWAKKRQDLYIKPVKMRVDGNNIKIMCAYNGAMLIDRKYIKHALLFHFNY